LPPTTDRQQGKAKIPGRQKEHAMWSENRIATCGAFMAAVAMCLCIQCVGSAQTFEQQLSAEAPAALAQAAREQGDAARGAIVFYQPYLLCTKCHTNESGANQLGPDLTKLDPNVATDVYLIESILNPSKIIKEKFETIAIVTNAGSAITGLLVEDRADAVTLRDAAQDFKLVAIPKSEIDERSTKPVSIMPTGLVNQLASRQQFLDLARYLMDVAEHGPARALELEPPPSLYAAPPLPEYEKSIDHAGMIAGLSGDSFKRGEAIYNRLCINCHGDHQQPGSLPTSLRFASGKFKSGGDPYTMYQTLTRGFGMMVPQIWMVPEQKYDVIHYIRQAYLKQHNPSQYFPVDATYLASLPKGDTRGPKPVNIEPWVNMNYGPNLTATFEIGSDGSNFAYKGIAVRLDRGPGGVSRGRQWMVFEHDTLRVAAAWSGQGFIDWNGINFNGRHQVHPRVVGQVRFANPTGPGWANPDTGSFADDQRVVGRDGRRYGPLPREWAHFRGMYQHGDDVIVAYSVGDADVLELAGLAGSAAAPVFTRTLNIGPRSKDMVMQVAQSSGASFQLASFKSADSRQAGSLPHGLIVVAGGEERTSEPRAAAPLEFNGATSVEVAKSDDFEMTSADYSITARIKSKRGGTILCKTAPNGPWVPNGKTFFIRGGKLCFDIGWVGAVQSRRSVNDGQWHDVAMTFQHETGAVRLYIDGKLEGQGTLKPKQEVQGHVLRIGYTSPNFPGPDSFFHGEMSEVRFYQRVLGEKEIAAIGEANDAVDKLVARWNIAAASGEVVTDASQRGHTGKVTRGAATATGGNALAAGLIGDVTGAEWISADGGNLRLKIPAGQEPLKFTLWIAEVEKAADVAPLVSSLDIKGAALDLTTLTKGGPRRWPEILKTQPIIGNDDGAFAVDVLSPPDNNPWFCQLRLTGFDFLPDGDRVAVCSWDGDVWMVSGLQTLNRQRPDVAERRQPSGQPATPTLTWQRIASGLFQPLGVKFINGNIYVTCRDQLVVLHDLNGDGETDFYENFNSDHQVTEHFHEFAMGLQSDAAGNFYYAKSARHALTAIVPHHGTLLRVSKDGSRTDILATGFRAANGVCLNPDGSFIVTDQEGHWNPKNRINWVTPGGFYGNMFGYHDVTDSSDSAMQPPLCWITNAFDRSPAELLWVDSKAWGPLYGSLLNFSYGNGKVFVVPHEQIGGQMQGGMCQLPIPQFPTGVMRGRFHPADGQLYTCGMFAWAGGQQQPGGFYRIRYTGKPVQLPIGLHATERGMSITFSGPLDPQTAGDIANYAVKTWSLKRTANYGSQHYNEKPSPITAATLTPDRRTVLLTIPDIQPTWCMEIKYSVNSAEGQKVSGVIHNTVHQLRAENYPAR
jgi:putative heme-binding domain-containing protein